MAGPARRLPRRKSALRLNPRTRAVLARIDRERRMQERRASRFADLMQDLGYAFRGFRRQPGFALMVILTLGLGIGANATMFGVVDRLLIRPPAFLKHPDRFAGLQRSMPERKRS